MEKAIQIAYDKLFETKCRFAAEAGFDGIAVNFNGMDDKSEKAWEEAPEKINGILKTLGLSCVQTHLPYYDLLLSAEFYDEELEKNILNSIKVSGEINAPFCVYHPRSYIKDRKFSAEKAFEINKEHICAYVSCAEKYNTGIALENLPADEVDLPFYASEYHDLCKLCDAFNSERVSVCWDFGHALLLSFDMAEAIKHLGKRIKCTHIHNNRKEDGIDSHLTPDQGAMDWESAMGAIKEINYAGPLTLETHCAYQELGLLKSFAKHNYECLCFLERLM